MNTSETQVRQDLATAYLFSCHARLGKNHIHIYPFGR
jgi:hypothetical protein